MKSKLKRVKARDSQLLTPLQEKVIVAYLKDRASWGPLTFKQVAQLVKDLNTAIMWEIAKQKITKPKKKYGRTKTKGN